MRLDEALVARGLSPSRSRARDSVLRGKVMVNGTTARKPAQTVQPADDLQMRDEASPYASRAALKLKHALRHFGIVVEGRRAIDIGASTGGFTQVLLEEGAAHVIALDVGHGQMADHLAADSRVTLIERFNVRQISHAQMPRDISLIVCDVSFISLKLALPAALDLALAGTTIVALIKPQFEVGREHIGKGGVVADTAYQRLACKNIETFLSEAGWNVLGVTPSPVDGRDGNREFLVAAVKRKSVINESHVRANGLICQASVATDSDS